jgi:hypothetical protein
VTANTSADNCAPLLVDAFVAPPDILRLTGILDSLGIDQNHKLVLNATHLGSDHVIEKPIIANPPSALPFQALMRTDGAASTFMRDRAHPCAILEPAREGQLKYDMYIQPKRSYFVLEKAPSDYAERRRLDQLRENKLLEIRADLARGFLPTFFDTPHAYIRVFFKVDMTEALLTFLSEKPRYRQLNWPQTDTVDLAKRLGLFEAIARTRKELRSDSITLQALGASFGSSMGKNHGSVNFGLIPAFGMDPSLVEATVVTTIYRHWYQQIAARYPKALGYDEPQLLPEQALPQPSIRQSQQPWPFSLFRRMRQSVQIYGDADSIEKAYMQLDHGGRSKPIMRTFKMESELGPFNVDGYEEYLGRHLL